MTKPKLRKQNEVGIAISFEGLSFKQRLSIWWSFTLACFLQKETFTKYKVKNITVENA